MMDRWDEDAEEEEEDVEGEQKGVVAVVEKAEDGEGVKGGEEGWECG